MRSALLALCALLFGAGCGSHAETHDVSPDRAGQDGQSEQGEVVTPPFAVHGDLSGLLVVWYDGDGTHTARTLADIPAAHRDAVRIDSLRLGPDERLDSDSVWVADVRQAGANGSYTVRRFSRDSFDARVAAAQLAAHPVQPQVAQNDVPQNDEPPPQAGDASSDVVIYGATWCGACRAAQSYLRQRGVPFVEKDIEREPGAQEEMLAKAARAGLRPSGIPVIDFRGHILLGFDQRAIDDLIVQTAPAQRAPSDGTGTPI